jgi:hypothetical protein
MRKKTPAGPVRILSAEQRAKIEQQMREQGRLRAASATELEKLRRRKAMIEAQHVVTGSQQ